MTSFWPLPVVDPSLHERPIHRFWGGKTSANRKYRYDAGWTWCDGCSTAAARPSGPEILEAYYGW